MKSSGMVNVGLKKQLAQDRATLSLRLTDLFYMSRWYSTLRYNNVDMVVEQPLREPQGAAEPDLENRQRQDREPPRGGQSGGGG